MTESRRRHTPLTASTVTRRRAAGFTLVELMVSIALALLLILGINAVFKISSDTVGSGMQLAEMMRQFRTAQTALGNDFDVTHFASRNQSPALILESYNQPAFRDRNDELAAIQAGYDPTSTSVDAAQAAALNVRDADGNPIYPLAGWTNQGINASNVNIALPQVINNRNHRVDVLSFFIRNPNSMQRQTPNYPNGVMDTNTSSTVPPAQYQGRYKSTQAWVVYGHVLQPDNTVAADNILKFNPGQPGGQTHFLGLGLTRDPYTGHLYTSGATPIATNPNDVNPNNFYSTNWILGRTAILLGEPSDLDNFSNPNANNNPLAPPTEPQTYAKDPKVDRPAYTQSTNPADTVALRPLSWGTQIWGTQNNAGAALTSPNGTSPTQGQGGIQIQTSQADVAGASLQTLHDKALQSENPLTAPTSYLPQWYMPLLTMGYGALETQNPQLPPALKPTNWVWPTNGTPTTALGYGPWHTYRFMAQAWPDKLAANGQPMVSGNVAAMHQQMAAQTPIFLRGCSQFIVEYAGDYLQQTASTVGTVPAGTISGIGEDGQIDFDAIPDPTTKDASGNATVIKRIRWYGMTRSLDDGVSVENTKNDMVVLQPGTPGSPPANQEIVRPLYRYIQQYTKNGGAFLNGGPNPNFTHMPFEKINADNGQPGGPWYTGFPDSRNAGSTTPQNVDSYTCAWGPLEQDLDLVTTQYVNDTFSWAQLFPLVQPVQKTQFPSRSLLPWMIRITIRLSDPSGRLPDGQTMQFVYTIPRPH